MRSSWLFAAVPALLCSTSLVQADDAHALISLSGSIGGTVMDLPDGGGSFEGAGVDQDNDLLYGVTLGFSASADLGQWGDVNAHVGLSGFATYVMGDFSKTYNFTGPGVVIIQGGAGPNLGAISISTSSTPGVGANSSISITNLGPEANSLNVVQAASSIPTGAQDAPFVSASGQSFAWGGAQTAASVSDARAAAYAAIADTNGGVFVAAGDLDGLSIGTTYRTEALYGGGDLTFGISGRGDGDVTLQGYVGPSYRYLGQRNSSTSAISVDVPEYANTTTEFPLFGMSSTEELGTHYIGGVIGASATIQLDEKSSFTLGGELGGYYTKTALNSSGTYTAEGGGPIPYILQTVTSEGATEEDDGYAFAARGTAVYTVALNENTQLNFSGMIDYLSNVAQPAVNAVVMGYDGTDTGSVTYASGGSNPSISWGKMFSFTGAVTLTGQF